jgi:hypothetical protein
VRGLIATSSRLKQEQNMKFVHEDRELSANQLNNVSGGRDPGNGRAGRQLFTQQRTRS